MSAVTYEVSVSLEERQEAAFEEYMLGKHIPEVLATGCFLQAALERSSPGHYRTRYEAASSSDVDRYQELHTAALREDFIAHFPHATASRLVWEAVSADRKSGPG